MRRSGDGVTTRRSSGSGRSSSCSREIDWIADEHGGLQRPSKRFKAQEWKKTAECLSHKTGNSVKRRNTWSQDEDDILIQMVGPHCKNKWSDIARSIPGRSGRQWQESLIEGISPHQHVNTSLPPFSLFDLIPIKATRWLFEEKYCFRGLDILQCSLWYKQCNFFFIYSQARVFLSVYSVVCGVCCKGFLTHLSS